MKFRAKLKTLCTGFRSASGMKFSCEVANFAQGFRGLIRKNRQNFEEVLQEAHQKAHEGDFTEVEIATFYDANHEIYSANKAFLEAMADMLLSPDEISEIENLPEMQ